MRSCLRRSRFGRCIGPVRPLWRTHATPAPLTTVAGAALRVSPRDIEDFRLRAWRFLKAKGAAAPAELNVEEKARIERLEIEGKAEWEDTLRVLESGGAQRVLGGSPHVEKDKQILRDLLAHAVRKNSLHGAQSMYRSIAAPLQRGNTQNDCYRLMMDLGVVSNSTNPCVMRYTGQPLVFPPEVMAQVSQLQQLHDREHDADARTRQDQRHARVYTIDAATASEIDDAIGLWCDERGRTWAAIHVADPARLVTPQSVLGAYVAQRGTSVFLPERHFPLMPQALSTPVFSIVPGRVTHTLTFCARLCPDTGALLEGCIFPSLVENVIKISYKGVDALCKAGTLGDDHPELVTLMQFAQLRRSYRESSGACTVQLPEPKVTVTGKQVSIVVDQNFESASRSLVEEMMILAGQVAAEFARRNGVPIPFRVQQGPSTRPRSLIGNSNLHKTMAAEVAHVLKASARTVLDGPAFMDATPRRHASIGLDAYSQVTSPIRRYPDLMAAFQLKAFLRGDALPFSSWDILQYRSTYEIAMRQADALQSASVRYWVLRHLEETPALRQQLRCVLLPPVVSNSSPVAYLRGVAPDRALPGDIVAIYIMDLGLRATLQLQRGREYGDVVMCRVRCVDSLLNKLELDDMD